jgi:transcriptional regulator with XRE-family HTH domain
LARSRGSDVDRFLGHRVKQQRLLASMTQQHLAAQLGVSPQQVSKLETGKDQVSASQLLLIARLFEVPVGELFAGYDGGASVDRLGDRKTSHMLHDLAQAFLKLESKHQEALSSLVRVLAAETLIARRL